ncbi:MAG TPA: hypothetical protein VFN25_13975 [Dokdonella sp.]|uniref:hypothetical protein n=1 Tax=Dokdonella sp. TaxID=2291710 RepID=UPI002D8019CA|nr:hypothetical protein [Dokdonella sp.]HET9033996.1 hypothetical protein [Dokdonella sp.]
MSRLIQARMLLAVAITVTIGVLEIGKLIAPMPQANTEHHTPPAQVDAVPMLSTIHVSAPEQIPTLPLVIVRPIVGQTLTGVSTQAVASVSRDASHSHSSGSSGMPHGRLDMPYYSFGRMLPNAIKD